MTVGSLFSGIGGFDLGFERAGFEIKWQVEIDPFCRRVLEKHWPAVRRYEDVQTVGVADLDRVDVVCGGFPCQDISSSGAKSGLAGMRSGLWREFARVVGELRPAYAVVENVTDLLSRGLGDVLGDLAALGYDAEWHSIPAAFVGLPQARERVWIIAYLDGGGCEGRAQRHCEGPLLVLGTDDDRLAVGQHRARDARSWVRRANAGLPHRVDRTRGLGNSLSPQIAELIACAIASDRLGVRRGLPSGGTANTVRARI